MTLVTCTITTNSYIYIYIFQNLKNQIMTTNLWVEQVSVANNYISLEYLNKNEILSLHGEVSICIYSLILVLV